MDTSIVANRGFSQKSIVDPDEPSLLDLHCLQRYLYWSEGMKGLIDMSDKNKFTKGNSYDEIKKKKMIDCVTCCKLIFYLSIQLQLNYHDRMHFSMHFSMSMNLSAEQYVQTVVI